MRVKHCKLIASVVVLVGLLGLPLAVETKVIEDKHIEEVVKDAEMCKAEREQDPLFDVKLHVHSQLKYVYGVNQKDIDWWTHYIAESSVRWQVPSDYIITVVAIESEFNAQVKTHNGLVGPGQIRSYDWKQPMKKRFNLDIHKPSDNIIAIGYILDDYRDQCGNWDCALKSYNVGPGAYKRGEKKDVQRLYHAKATRHLAMLKQNKKRG